MSIEPTCIYCNAVDKFRCRSQEQANSCKTYLRRMDALQKIRNPEPEVRPVTIEEIDAAIETLQRVKKEIGARNVRATTSRR